MHLLFLHKDTTLSLQPHNADTKHRKELCVFTPVFNIMHLLLIVDKLYARPAVQFNFCPLFENNVTMHIESCSRYFIDITFYNLIPMAMFKWLIIGCISTK